jgi:hypothetical protein
MASLGSRSAIEQAVKAAAAAASSPSVAGPTAPRIYLQRDGPVSFHYDFPIAEYIFDFFFLIFSFFTFIEF